MIRFGLSGRCKEIKKKWKIRKNVKKDTMSEILQCLVFAYCFFFFCRQTVRMKQSKINKETK